MSDNVIGAGAEGRGRKVRAMLQAVLGQEVFAAWFKLIEFEAFDGKVVTVSVAVTFLRNWIREHYTDQLLKCCQEEFKGAQRVEVVVRTPKSGPMRQQPPADGAAAASPYGETAYRSEPPRRMPPAQGVIVNHHAGGFEGSPLDSRYTFESFVVGATNRMAHAGAIQVAETIMSETPVFNPLYIHSPVGLGKTHLLHAIASEARRRAPHAQVLYLTAERFRYTFVEALRTQAPSAFKEKFRSINLLLIDDLEFLQGERTELEFEHIINALLDGGRQVVVASSSSPSQATRLNERMRSRLLQRGLATEIGGFDFELRLKVLERRVAEKRSADPTFDVSRDVMMLLAERLTENGRELEGAVTRLHWNWSQDHTPTRIEDVEKVIRDLVHDVEPKRIKIEDILKVIARHFGVSKTELLSKRRHRAVVWPRQIGMYLAKQLTARSLPEIGRRFGDRDHTTVLHAIRKIEGELTDNSKLRDELEELKKLLHH